MSFMNGHRGSKLDAKAQIGNGHASSSSSRMEEIVTPEYPVDPLLILGEKSFGAPRIVPESEVGSPIQEFFRDACVLITGGTGFMGKTLTEKLLRVCPHLKRIYLLIRMKKGKTAPERLEEIVQDRLFLRIQAEVPDFRSKISVVAGDIAEPNLGLSSAARAALAAEVTVVIHGAATVRFDEAVKTAVKINILGARSMLELAREMPRLKAFVHVSTAFSHCPRSEIDEVFYDPPCSTEEFIEQVLREDDAKLEKMTPELLGKWPNTYTLTKAFAEDLVRNEGKDLPLAMIRPSVIVSTYREPVRGWIDNPYGPVGMMVGSGLGLIHVTLNDVDNTLDVVPIDMVVSAILAAAWKTGVTERDPSIPIYNFVSSAQKPLVWRQFADMVTEDYASWPMINAVWAQTTVSTRHRLVYFWLNLFLHYLPGYILDAGLRWTGRQPMFCKLYRKMDRASETLAYFALREWAWRDHSVRALWASLSPADQRLFFFHMGDMNWAQYIETVALGLRVYLMKDEVGTLPAARRKAKIQRLLHQALKSSLLALCLWLLLLLLRSVLGHFSNRTLILCTVVGLHLFTFARTSLKSSSALSPKSKTD